jgi:hypothetical protein
MVMAWEGGVIEENGGGSEFKYNISDILKEHL